MADTGGASHWSRIQERGSIWGLRFTVGCYRLLGRTLSLPLVYAVVSYFFATDPKGRAASRAFLERVRARRAEASAEPGRSVPVGWRESFRHYREFALSIADRVSLWGDPPGTFEFDFCGREHFNRLHEAGKGALLLGAHLGSFDALRVVSVDDGVRVNVLMYTRHAPRINQVFREISRDVDLRVLSAADDAATTALRIRGCLDRGEHVAILADRVEPNDRRRVRRMEFLGRTAEFPESPFLLAAVLGCPTLMLVALRRSSRCYEIIAEPLVDERAQGELTRATRSRRAGEIAAAYVAQLERLCLRAPRQWFNFYDFWAGANPS